MKGQPMPLKERRAYAISFGAVVIAVLGDAAAWPGAAVTGLSIVAALLLGPIVGAALDVVEHQRREAEHHARLRAAAGGGLSRRELARLDRALGRPGSARVGRVTVAGEAAGEIEEGLALVFHGERSSQ